MALSNKELIKKAYERISEIGWDFSSKKYMDYAVFQITDELKKENAIARLINITNGNAQIMEEVEKFPAEKTGEFINELLKRMGVRLISIEFKNNLDENVEKEMINSGVRFE